MLNVIFKQEMTSSTRFEIALIDGKYFPYKFAWQGDNVGIQWGNEIAQHTIEGVKYASQGYTSLANAKRAGKSAGYIH